MKRLFLALLIIGTFAQFYPAHGVITTAHHTPSFSGFMVVHVGPHDHVIDADPQDLEEGDELALIMHRCFTPDTADDIIISYRYTR